MGRTRRQQPHFAALTVGPLGQLFLRVLRDLMGGDLCWDPGERVRPGRHVFRLWGPRADGLLTETRATEGVYRIYEWVFRGDLPGVPTILESTYTAYRWDPRRAAGLIGDRSGLDGPDGRRYRVLVERNAEASARDRLTINFVPAGDADQTPDGRPANVRSAGSRGG